MGKTRQGRRDVAALEARRFKAARLFARGAGQVAVMHALGVSRQTAHQWYHGWRRGGRQGLKAVGRLGRKPRLDRRQLDRVETALLQGPRRHGFATDLWTLPRVATVIARLTGVSYHPGHVWYLLRGLQWSLQRPARVPSLGRAGRPQEPDHAGLPGPTARLADGRTAAWVRAGAEPRRTGVGQRQGWGTGQRLRRRSRSVAAPGASGLRAHPAAAAPRLRLAPPRRFDALR